MKTAVTDKKYIKLICIILILAWMTFIFMMSAQTADVSDESSGGFVDIIAKLLSIDENSPLYSVIVLLVRKSAHMFEYAVLGALILILLFQYSLSTKNRISFALLGCVIYSVTDEIHQYFIPGRACRFTDVLIDTSGALIGILLTFLIIRLILKKR